MIQIPSKNAVAGGNRLNSARSGLLGSPLSFRVLCLTVLLFIPVQWIVGRHPGSTSIFSPQHQELVQQFTDVKLELRRQLIAQCVQHGVHDIIFAFTDVISPYVVNEIEATPGCKAYRETAVTRIALARKLACSSEVVDESRPDAWNPIHHAQTLGPLEGVLVPVSTWEPEGRQFGFQLQQAKECTDQN
jgi:hypothetical protein